MQSFASWITVTGSTFGGTSGAVNFTVAANPAGTPRSGTIQVGDQVFTIQQVANTCSYALNAAGARFTSTGGPGAFLASQNVIGCTPYVTSNPEITLSPYIQSGNQFTQNYSVATYNSLTRWGAAPVCQLRRTDLHRKADVLVEENSDDNE